MTTKLQSEWRIVFPNGEQWGETGEKAAILERFDKAIESFKDNGIPQQQWPKVEGRVVEVTITRSEGEWRDFGEIERRMQQQGYNVVQPGRAEPVTGRHAQVPQDQVARQFPDVNWPPTEAQLYRIKQGNFTYSAPCVICGVTFNQCPHDHHQTEAFINQVKQWKARRP